MTPSSASPFRRAAEEPRERHQNNSRSAGPGRREAGRHGSRPHRACRPRWANRASLRELPTLWVQTRDLNGLIGLQMRRNLLLRRNRLLKQTIDRLFALALGIASALIIRCPGAVDLGGQRGLAILRAAPRRQGRPPDQGLEAPHDVPRRRGAAGGASKRQSQRPSGVGALL
jgi:hypothetical protein